MIDKIRQGYRPVIVLLHPSTLAIFDATISHPPGTLPYRILRVLDWAAFRDRRAVRLQEARAYQPSGVGRDELEKEKY